ncbi:MAG: hypothetical protein JW797_19520 [Bradymonadales bacterium]|nr:hypothetical protein [Bradymonadales bacterium]
MKTSDSTPPDGLPAALRRIADDQPAPEGQTAPDDDRYGDPPVTELPLGGITPRVDEPERKLSGDLYIRLEGEISGPFQPERLESLLTSGILTGLEEVSADLNHWTPLAYHPRIVRGRVKDLRQVRKELKKLSELPAPRGSEDLFEPDVPLCAIVKRPKHRRTTPAPPLALPALPSDDKLQIRDDDTEPDFSRDRKTDKP